MLLPLLFACGSERGVREAPDAVTYGGWVYQGPPSGEVVLADGALTFAFPGCEPADDAACAPIAAEQPYADYPGYWLAAELPPSTPFELRVEGEGAYPTVWAGDTPGANGSWFAGAIFAGEVGYVDTLVESVAPALSNAPGALADGAIHLWGVPNDGEAWDCAALTVQGVAPVCFLADETGALAPVTSGPFTWFFAFDLAPGEVVLDDGEGPVETWTATEGDLVMALWLEHR